MLNNSNFLTKHFALGLVLSFTLGLQACAQNNYLEEVQAVVLKADGTPADDSKRLKKEESEPKQPNIPPRTLRNLMLGELALHRQMPELALNYYREEAYKTRDVGVIKRGLEISTWLEAHKASLEFVNLWQEAEPDNPDAYRYMARQQLAFNRVKGALASIGRVLDLGADYNFDLFNQVLARIEKPEQLDALRKLELLSDRHPRNSQIWLARSHVHTLLDQRQAALDTSAKSIRLDRNDVRPLVMNAELKFNYNDQKAALSEMKRGLRRFPDSPSLNLLYAQSLMKMSKDRQAKAQVASMRERFHRSPEMTFRLASLSTAFGFNEEALELYQESVENRYRVEDANFQLSGIQEHLGNYPKAIEYLHRILPGAGFVEARLRIAFLLKEQGLLEEALVSLEEARIMQPGNAESFYFAGADFLHEAKQTERGFDLLSQALEERPNSTRILYSRSMLAESLDRLDVVEQDLLKVIELEPRNANALNALGYTLTNKTDRHEEALVYIEKAYEISPNEPAIIDSMGWVNYRLGNYEKAIAYLREAIALEPDHEIAAHLGEVLWVSGSEDEAQRVWDEALARKKDSEILQSVMKRFLEP